MATNEQIQKKITGQFGGQIIAVEEQFSQLCLTVQRQDHLTVLQFLRDDPDLSFDFLIDLFGVDYLAMGGLERFAVIYHLYSMKIAHRLRIKVFVPERDAHLDSVSALWAAANWAEREVYDMYGIRFDGHPDLHRILCPDDFSGFPLRKDFPLQGIGYRENFEKITRQTAQ